MAKRNKNTEKDKNPDPRQHQKDAIDKIKPYIKRGSGRGKVISPTGTGKTRIESDTICEIVKFRIGNEEWGGVHVFLTPRILLTSQQLQEVSRMIAKTEGMPNCDFMNVNSGDFNSAEMEKELLALGYENPSNIESTTNSETIAIGINKAKTENIPLIIFSTYHSVDKVKLAAEKANVQISSYICDEAQYLVSSGGFKDIVDYPSDYMFFFTATEKFTNDMTNGLGMGNEAKFGKVIFTESPKTMIDRGEMASVALHFVGVKNGSVDEDQHEAYAEVVISAYGKHCDVLDQYAFGGKGAIGGKLHVVCYKQDSLKGIMKSDALINFKRQHPDVKIFALSSDYGISIDGINSPRANNKEKEKLLSQLRAMKITEKAIVFHVDMLSEGIDVKGITGVMPFRNLGKIKFLQNIGRGTRLVDEDRKRLYSGEIAAKDFSKYVKPYCWLILPVLSNDYNDAKLRYSEWILTLRELYDFKPNETVIIDNIVGPAETDGVEDKVGKVDKKFFTGHGLASDIIHEVEEAEQMQLFMEHKFSFKGMSAEQQMQVVRNIFDEE